MIPKELFCPICGGKLTDQGAVSASGVHFRYANDQKAAVRSYSCEKCGRDIDMLDPMEEDRSGVYSAYWNEHKDELLS